MRSILFALIVLSLSSTALASKPLKPPKPPKVPKADVCHWTEDGFYKKLHVNINSIHFNPAIHPHDVAAGMLYVDNDGDGFGDPDKPVYGCPGPGLVSNQDDCDDNTLGAACPVEFDLYALVNGEIVGIDTETGSASSYLTTELSSNAYHLTWDPNEEVFYTLEDAYNMPRLITVEPCGGTVIADVPLTTVNGGPVYFCEGFDYDRYNNRLVGSCSLNGTIAKGDCSSESIVEIDVSTGEVVVLATNPTTGLQSEYDMLVFVGADARAGDGQGTLVSNRWCRANSITWETDLLVSSSSPYGSVAWDWENNLLYSVSYDSTSTPFQLQIQDEDTRAVLRNIGDTGLNSNNTGMTFARFVCN